MRKDCPECHGKRRMYYSEKPDPIYVVQEFDPASAVNVSVAKALEDCRGCNGSGSVEITDRIPVYQFGVKIGTVPHNFDPENFVSRSVMYRPRRGDFQQIGLHFDASPSLGDGDLEAVPGFQWERAQNGEI